MEAQLMKAITKEASMREEVWEALRQIGTQVRPRAEAEFARLEKRLEQLKAR